MSGRTASTGAMEVSGRSTAASPRAAAAGPWRRSEEAGDALDRAGPPRCVLRLPLALVLLALPPLGRALPVASAAAAAPDRHYRYGNPTSVPCQPGEVNMTIKGVPGIFCSPPCSASRACPSLGNAQLHGTGTDTCRKCKVQACPANCRTQRQAQRHQQKHPGCGDRYGDALSWRQGTGAASA